MKKRLIIFMPSIEGGGVEKNLFIVSNYLSKKLDDVSIITISNKFKNKFKNKINFISPKFLFWDNLSRKKKYILSIFLLINEILKDRNLIVFSFQANVYCILVCKLFGIKVISRSNSAPIGWSQNYIKKYLFKKILNLADKVMVNSYEFKKDLKKNFNVNAVCIYNPLDINEIIIKSKRKSKNFFRKTKLKILNIGRYTEQKDQITLLKALNEIKEKIDFFAVLVGRGILKNKLQKYINKKNLNHRIILKDFLHNPYPIIKQSDIFILSSFYEGLPNVLLEAAVLKKFIISSNCRTGPKEILLNGKGGYLFKVNDYKNLSKLIVKFVKNKKNLKRKINLTYKSLNRFDSNLNLRKYLKLIKSVHYL